MFSLRNPPNEATEMIHKLMLFDWSSQLTLGKLMVQKFMTTGVLQVCIITLF